MPEVWYDMETDDFSLMSKGFFAKRKSDEMNFANVGFIIDALATGLSGKKPDYKKFIKGWFGESEKSMSKEQLKERSDSIRDRLKLMNKVLEEKEKNAGTAKNNNRRRRNQSR